MKYLVTDLDEDFDDFIVNGNELIDYARELRGANSSQEYKDPKNIKQAIKVLRNYCNIEVTEL